jgi:hypothetical protein
MILYNYFYNKRGWNDYQLAERYNKDRSTCSHMRHQFLRALKGYDDAVRDCYEEFVNVVGE